MTEEQKPKAGPGSMAPELLVAGSAFGGTLATALVLQIIASDQPSQDVVAWAWAMVAAMGAWLLVAWAVAVLYRIGGGPR